MKNRPIYTVVLHPKRGYIAGGYGTPGRKWRGMKQFKRLADALKWVDKVRRTAQNRTRPWESFQVLEYKDWNSNTLLFAPLMQYTH